MFKEQRKFRRFPVKLEVELTLYDADTGEYLIDPAAASIYNISREGAVLELSEVIRQGRHLFFAPLESDNITFNLTVCNGDEKPNEPVVFHARPIWFNRNMESDTRSFLIGIEFQDRLNRDVFNHLIS